MDNTKPPTEKIAGERKSFSSEFKKEAVARLKSTANASALAVELGVRRNQLYKWEKQSDAAGAGVAMRSPGRPPRADESAVDRLRRENKRLEMENAILKKAGAYLKALKP
jgi:transposase